MNTGAVGDGLVTTAATTALLTRLALGERLRHRTRAGIVLAAAILLLASTPG